MSILVTYAVSLLIEGALNMIFSVNDVQISAWYVDRSFRVFGIYIAYIYLFGFILAAVLLTALYFMLYRTRFGASVRASLADQTAAALVGIDVRRVSTICFGIGVAVTAAGGMVYGATNSFNASTSYDLISRLLIIIVLGAWEALAEPWWPRSHDHIEDIVAVAWSPVWSTLSFFSFSSSCSRYVPKASSANSRRELRNVSEEKSVVARCTRVFLAFLWS